MANKGDSSLALFSSKTKFQEPGTLEEITNSLLKVSPSFLARLFGKCEHDLTKRTGETNERGRITELETENDKTDKKENYHEEAMMSSIKNCYHNLPSVSERFIKILTFPLNLIRGPAKVIYYPSEAYAKIKAHLIHLEDNGDFEEFDIYSRDMVKIYQEKGDIDIVAAITIEQARCSLYRNDFNAAIRLARKARNLAEHTSFPPLFHGQAFIVMSDASRNKNKLGVTKEYLDLAWQCFEFGYCVEDLAHFHEVYGCYLDKLLGTFAKPDEQVKELAITNFNKMSEIASQDSRSRVRDKNRFYAEIRRARILLDSNSLFGRQQRMVKQDSIDLVAKHLHVIKRDLLDSMPRGSKIQFHMVESDLLYRQGKFGDAIELLGKNFEHSKMFGFKTEGPKITQRIQEIEQRVEKNIDVVDQNVAETESSNGGLNDTDTSQSDSDAFTSKYL